MKIVTSVETILTDLTARLTANFDSQEQALQGLAGLGVVIILLLFLVAQSQSKRNQKRNAAKLAEPMVLSEKVRVTDSEPSVAPTKDAGPKDADEQDLAANDAAAAGMAADAENAVPVATVDGFVLHHRKSKKATAEANLHHEDPEAALVAIEQEMLATRQLYLDGVISKEVYVSETRALYGKAQQNM
ncbi:MAG: hypothetical protein VW987_06915 [Alphaproteobacteria bacterium]